MVLNDNNRTCNADKTWINLAGLTICKPNVQQWLEIIFKKANIRISFNLFTKFWPSVQTCCIISQEGVQYENALLECVFHQSQHQFIRRKTWFIKGMTHFPSVRALPCLLRLHVKHKQMHNILRVWRWDLNPFSSVPDAGNAQRTTSAVSSPLVAITWASVSEGH